VDRNIGQNYEYSYHYISVTVVLFIVVIKHVIYVSPRRVCPPVPRGSFHCFEKENGESGWCDVTTISPISGHFLIVMYV
jgi:hypothetical protein